MLQIQHLYFAFMVYTDMKKKERKKGYLPSLN